MKSFKQYVKANLETEKTVEVPEPIHFRGNSPRVVELPEPIHFRGTTKKVVKEDAAGNKTPMDDALAHNSFHHGFNPHDMSEKLHNATAHTIKPLSADQAGVERYVENSSGLNHSLIHHGEPTRNADKDAHDAIMKHAKPTGMHFHVFSGVSPELGELASKHEKGTVFHSKAHLSTTHSERIVNKFSTKHEPDDDGIHPAFHIHVKPHDKVLHVSHFGEYADEHETVIPAGTKLKKVGEYDHVMGPRGAHDRDDRKAKVRVHHFEIHSQE